MIKKIPIYLVIFFVLNFLFLSKTTPIYGASPSTPGTPSATSDTNINTPTWEWTASSSEGDGFRAAGSPTYVVQWSTDSNFSTNIESSTTDKDTVTFTHSAPLTDGTWYFRVKAVDQNNNESSFSSSGSITISTTGQLTTIPDSDTWVTNGEVYALATKENTAYIGGSFTVVGPNTGYGVPINSSTGVKVTTFPKVNSTVNSVISDGSGGWYIGGIFSKVGNYTRNGLAHILSDGTVDLDWDPNITSNSNNGVWTLVLSPDGNTLYIGGTFQFIGANSRNNIAALNSSTGALLSWNPNADNAVREIIVTANGNTIYAAGTFTTIGGQSRNRIAKLDTSGNADGTWNPNATSGTIFAISLSSDEANIYAGGSFTTIGGQTRNRLAKLNTSGTGSADETWNPNASSTVDVFAISSDGNSLYAGGHFTTIGGQSRNRLAKLSTSSTGSADETWNPNPGSFPETLLLSSDDNSLYVGGQFTTIGGQSRNRIAKLSTSAAGNADETWNPNASDYVYSVARYGDTLYAGGDFHTIGGKSRTHLAALDISSGSSGTANYWNPGTDSSVVYDVAVSSDGNMLLVGGAFKQAGGNAQRYFAQFGLYVEPTPTSNAVSGSSSSSSSSSSDAPKCSDEKPSSAPDLFQVENLKNKVNLYFVPAKNPVSYYYISYGLTEKAEGHGIKFNYGDSSGLIKYTINDLEVNNTYYFKVRGGNGCATGYWSNIVKFQNKKGGNSSKKIPPAPFLCSAKKPKGFFDQIKVKKNNNKAEISFSPLKDNVTYYYISYGTKKEANDDGVKFKFKEESNPIKFTIRNLNPKKEYYFKIRAENDCATGNWSNVMILEEKIYDLSPDREDKLLNLISRTPDENLTQLIANIINNFNSNVTPGFLGINTSLKDSPAIIGIQTASTATVAFIIAPKTYTSLYSTINTAKSMSYDILLIILRFILAFPIFGPKKKARSWGVVYDSLTKLPIDPAVVTLFKKSKKMYSKITDMEGKFGFLIDKGKYSLNVIKTNFIFPSKILKGKTVDRERGNLYFGEEINAKNPDLINVSIPMDPQNFDWNQANKPISYKPPIFVLNYKLISLLTWFGFLASIAVFIINPIVWNTLVVASYFIILPARHIMSLTRKWGTVYDSSTMKVLPLVKVKSRWITGTSGAECLTDHLGRYYLILNEGTYHLDVEKETEKGKEIIKSIGPLEVKRNRSIVAPNIQV